MIGTNQTGFIKGRNILEGVVILHEVIHELRSKKKKGLILKIDFEKAYDRVRWDFLKEVLRGKGFPNQWIRWVMQTIEGGKVCVNINGQRSPYFRTFRGLRQGDPLSPLLFNIVVDTFRALLEKAVEKNYITGVLTDLIPGGISHIQYADDTVIMVDGSQESIVNLKILLYCFEWLSGLKINFHKTEVYVFGFSQEEKEAMANMLNCKLGELPMKYLGIPISDNGVSAFSDIYNKMRKRLDPWKGKSLSSGGRLTLTDTCLSSLPTYLMGFYKIPASGHEKMDSIRSNFFWEGADGKSKYHMAKWQSVCIPRDQGGLGVTNTHIMNDCLLVKWIWKIMLEPDDLWFKLLKTKYMTRGGFFQSNCSGASQFWKGLHKVKHLFKLGALHRVRDGQKTSVWHDTWLGNLPLKFQYPSLYDFCENKQAMVGDYLNVEVWNIDLNRCLTVDDIESWDHLMLDLYSALPAKEAGGDIVTWGLETSGMFTARSLYRFLTNGGVVSKMSDRIWECKVPLKIKIFLWQISHGKLPAAATLKARGWKGNHRCVLCGEVEEIEHIFFSCPLSSFVWYCVKEALSWEGVPTSMDDLLENWPPNGNRSQKSLGLFIFAGLMWAIWRTRNKMAIEKIFPRKPIETLLYGLSFLQKWEILLKEEDKRSAEQTRETLMAWSRSFTPSSMQATDIYEL